MTDTSVLLKGGHPPAVPSASLRFLGTAECRRRWFNGPRPPLKSSREAAERQREEPGQEPEEPGAGPASPADQPGDARLGAERFWI